jgi:hypothetical protein
MGTILNWLQSLLAIDRSNISDDKLSPPQFLECILHSTITPVSKGEEPSHVISIISFGDQLVRTLEKFYWGLEPNHFIGCFEGGHDCLSFGMQLAWSMLVVTEQIPHESLEREGVSHRIHAYRGDNFKITLGGAQGQLVDVLIRVRHLGHILIRLVTGHEFYVRNI